MRWTVVIFLVLAMLLLFSRGDGAYTAYQASVAVAPLEGITSTTANDAGVSDATQTQDTTGGARAPDALQTQDLTAPTLSITSQQTTYLVGEPLNLEIQLANETADTVAGITRLEPEFGFFRLMISADGQEFKTYRGPGWDIKDTLIVPTEMVPGEAVSHSTTILHNRKGTLSSEIQTTLAFPSPGRYILRAEFNDRITLTAEAKTLAIDVVEPQGIDADAWKLIRSKEAIYFLHTGTARQDPEIVRKFEQLLSLYPESRYAEYVDASVQPNAASLQAVSPENAEVSGVVSSFAAALNARDYAAVVSYSSLELKIQEMWESGGEDQEAIRQSLFETAERLGNFAIEIDHMLITGLEATADITLISGNLGSFDSFIKLVKDSDGTWRIIQTGF